MDRPLTAREAQFVRENPQLNWPADIVAEAWCFRPDQMQHYDGGTDPTLPDPELTRAEAWCFRLDQMQHYDGGADPTLPDPELTRAESKLIVLTLTAAAFGAIALGSVIWGLT